MTTIPAEKLDKLVSRWQAVQGDLAAGADQSNFVRLSREFAELDPIVTTISALRKAQEERDGLREILDDSDSDPDMLALAQEEIAGRFGYEPTADHTAVDVFMRDYYSHAAIIAREMGITDLGL